MKHLSSFILCSLCLFSLTSCTQKTTQVSLPYEQYTLDNGLKVVLHQDHSDPMVALAIQYHVGSGREKIGKTGFAHFFEHMLFQRSENLPRNAFFQKIANMGGTFNGSTNTDGTNYFEVVPRDALEKILWMESDRMGFFINTVSQQGLEREIDIVSNEKRQNYDSKPYGHQSGIISKELFPSGHPYSWTTIGDIADLRGATLNDVKEFYSKYYTPGNATLVLSGDFDATQAKELIQKYFGEIAKGADVEKPKVQPLSLENTKKVAFEDSYALLPQLTVIFPGVENYNEDSYALSYLNSLLANGNNSPLYKVIVEEKKLAPSVSAYHSAREIAGYSTINIRAFDGVNLDTLYSAIEEAMARFESQGVDLTELEKLKMSQKTSTYNSLSSVQGKALMMARNNEFAGSPDKILDDLDKYKSVSAEDIMRVYEKYIKARPYFALSMVPKGQSALAMSDSSPADVVEEKVETQQMNSKSGKIEDSADNYPRTASTFDRSIEPEFLPNTPSVNTPNIWTKKLANGLTVYGITQNELPLIRFNINIKGGMLLDSPNKAGLAYINARLMNEGTELKTPEELEQAMGLLGARVNVYSGLESMDVYGSCLSENFDQVIVLVEEMLLKPRFDSAAFDRVKSQTISNIRQSSVNPIDIANLAARKLLYGNSVLSQSVIGTQQSIDSLSLDDVKKFYKRFFSPMQASLTIAGDISLDKCEKTLSSLVQNWEPKGVIIPEIELAAPAEKGRIYFIDYPGAQQSMVYVAKTAVPRNSPEYYPSTVVNNKLGGGSQGELFNVLRLQRGYTYGAYSMFECADKINLFKASSSVQGSATKESLDIFKDLIGGYAESFNAQDLETTKASLLRAQACSFETLGALVDVLGEISTYNLAFDFVKQEESVLKNMTLEQAKETIRKNINPQELFYLVIGDAKTQLKRLSECGLGEPILIDKDCKPINNK